ncbi:MAG: phytoene desaturase [Methanomicrobiaceae archaeon]|uniref:Phytoene dehydrogenase n=1 Tax=hydrocarbon metagenome TaxID=938273 RepID=A0A0W8FIV4_9ZZZZ|nr:phytoene desaturase [Methanomicrobiaceae archaeon]MDD5420048.1 phytoene desaturase family protein [Methanomicrobiaceae archaeon]
MNVVIVGAGFGGLSAAALLARQGFDVTVLEKNEQPGGRASTYREGGYSFDMGPSWYLMPDVYEKFFAEFGKTPEDFYDLARLDPSYRIYFDGGPTVDIAADITRNFALFDTFEESGGEKLRTYIDEGKEKYDLAIQEMLYRDYRSIFDMLDRRLLLEGAKLRIFESLETFVKRRFSSDEARRIVQYSVGFLGSSPRNTPAFYHMMSYIDLSMGVWYPDGGMRRVVSAIYGLARDGGADFRFNEPAVSIPVDGRTATGVATPERFYDADIVLVNADYPYSETALLPPAHQTYPEKYWSKREIAPSAFVCYLGLDRKTPALAHHTLFLDKDWEENFHRVFDPAHAAWPENPSYYVNVPSKTDASAAPEHGEALFVLVPLAPGLTDSPDLRERFYSRILDHLEESTGERIRDAVVVRKIFALDDFRDRYNAYRGTALGLTHSLWQTALWRPAHRSRKVENLYYTGQYTHPGIGVPMTLISSQIVARELGSTYR